MSVTTPTTPPGARKAPLYQVDVGYACFGIETDRLGTVVRAAPIGHWMVGKALVLCQRWAANKGGTVQRVG